jgi:phosphoribosyl-ATP pyrophosphohydrolase/phosphoribosyl-AMP cyclohydrolase
MRLWLTPPGVSVYVWTDAEQPPSRSSPSSRDPSSGGLPWPDVNGQRDQESPKPAGDKAGGLFRLPKQIPKGIRKKQNMSNETATIDFDKMDGLVPGIVQDARTGDVLMLGFLNSVSYAKTLESGFVTFWSRTRQKLWMTGETSGNRLRIVTTSTDCDNDTLLFRVIVEGDGLVCHEGTVSCFTRPIRIEAAGQKTEATHG